VFDLRTDRNDAAKNICAAADKRKRYRLNKILDMPLQINIKIPFAATRR
jgi:hypothetical protein